MQSVLSKCRKNHAYLAWVPAKFEHSNDDAGQQTTKQNDENTADIFYAERISLGILTFVLEHMEKMVLI